MARILIIYCDMKTSPDKNNKDEFLALYYREIAKTKPLSSEQEASLAKRIRVDDRDALNQLIRAAKRFDETRQFKFISYAVWWVRQSILQALSEQGRLIKLPTSRIGKLSRIHKAATKLEQQLGRPATPHEISQSLEMEVGSVLTSVEMGHTPISLDAPMSRDEETGLLETLSSDHENGPDKSMERSQLTQDVSNALHSLRPKEEAVLKMYFGIDPEVPHSLEEIGNRLNITRERVRQIKEKALSKMKHASRIKPLFSHIALS